MYQFLFYNTFAKKHVWFKTTQVGRVSLYTCGPTVYNYAHIGNLRTYIFEDILKRGLEFLGYQVYHVLNVTDVGHLESDNDFGEDKLNIAAQKERRTVFEIANYYEKVFFVNLKHLNIKPPQIICRATDYVEQMIEHICNLMRLDYAYEVNGNVYFRVKKFKKYLHMCESIDSQCEVNRVEIDQFKEDKRDFVLWFSNSKFAKQIMQWNSPWGKGFPGWHIECSVMSIYFFGRMIDIHCGGIDHIPIHHRNELAQSECLLQHDWVYIWLHGNFLVQNNCKMAKSSGNFLTLELLNALGFSEMHFRFFCIGVHYRYHLNFSFEALLGVKISYDKLLLSIKELNGNNVENVSSENISYLNIILLRIQNAIMFDLDTPKIVNIVWEILRSKCLLVSTKKHLLYICDRVLGLNLFQERENVILTDSQKHKINQRQHARKEGNWMFADLIRKDLEKEGIFLKDTMNNETQWYFKSGKRDLNPRL